MCFCRQDLLSGANRGPARETEETAVLDNAGILQLQNQIIGQQDQELDHMEETVQSTKVSTVLFCNKYM